MTLFRRKNRINLSSRNGQGTSDGSQLFIVHKRWMRSVANGNAVLVVAHHVLCPKTIPSCPDHLDALSSHRFDSRYNDRVNEVGRVRTAAVCALLNPSHQIKVVR